MDEFKSLINIMDRLLAPDGCPWDREQTLQSLRQSLMEEAYEVIEAIDLNNNQQMEEELGDLLFNIIFLCKVAEKEHRFTLEEVIRHITAKLVRRHPHIFGEASVQSSQEVVEQWEKIKQAEKGMTRKSLLDGIPKNLPSLTRAQKMAKKFTKKQFIADAPPSAFQSPEDQAGQTLWLLVQQLFEQGIQAEQALSKRLTQLEVEFRAWEQKN